MPTIKLGRRAVSGIGPVFKPTTFYDVDLKGFGLKAMPSGALSWIVEYRPGVGGRGVAKRRMVIGSASALTPDQARRAAADILAKVRLGQDPAGERTSSRKAETVRDLMTAYMDEVIRPKRKARTAKLFDGYLRRALSR